MTRTSATGTRLAAAGFTLLELLVVVAIAGTVLAVAAVNLFPSQEESARRETALLALDLEAARDAAWFGGSPAAVVLDGGRVRALSLTASRQWTPVANRERALGDAVRVTALAVDGTPLAMKDPIVFLPDGLGVPFRVEIEAHGLGRAIEGDAAGAIRVVPR